MTFRTCSRTRSIEVPFGGSISTEIDELSAPGFSSRARFPARARRRGFAVLFGTASTVAAHLANRAGCLRALSLFTASAMARMCSGVVPQQPPRMRAPRRPLRAQTARNIRAKISDRRCGRRRVAEIRRWAWRSAERSGNRGEFLKNGQVAAAGPPCNSRRWPGYPRLSAFPRVSRARAAEGGSFFGIGELGDDRQLGKGTNRVDRGKRVPRHRRTFPE